MLFVFQESRLAPSIPHHEPSTFAAGETVQWRRSYGDYAPTDGWTLSYYFAGAGIFRVDAVDTNGEWLITVDAFSTRKATAGTYRWTAYAENTTERRRVAAGTLVLTPDITKACPGDFLTFAEKALPVIEAAINNRLTVDQQSFQIDGTSIVNIPVLELKKLRSQFKAELWRARNPGKIGQPVHINFVRAR